jgi:2-methylisocitrate lyase-like PEP mutase family enzyme
MHTYRRLSRGDRGEPDSPEDAGTADRGSPTPALQLSPGHAYHMRGPASRAVGLRILASRENPVTTSQHDKAIRFRALHEGPGAFVIPNPWDAGSARILTGLGYRALATSSGASAGVLGRRDGRVTREEALAHARAIVGAVEIPVSADLEKGFGDAPEDAAETIRLAAGVGLVGGSIEDATGNPDKPLFDLSHAAERVAAAVQAARSLPFPFTLTARTENFLRGNPDLDDTIARLQAFERAGADVLMAPGLPDLESVRAVCAAVSKPVNFMAGIAGKSFTVAELEAAGVRRISLATSLYRAAMSALIAAATEVKDSGTFAYIDNSVPTPELNRFMQG